MSGRDEGYYGPSDADLGKGCAVLLMAAASILLMAVMLAFAFQDAGDNDVSRPRSDVFAGAVGDVPINAGDERAMHEAGLPTKRDVLEWHETGRWGYGRYEDGEYIVRTFDELPDGAALWDGIYGLDNSDPDFNYR